MQGGAMKIYSWTRLVVSIISIGGLMLLLNQGSVSAGETSSLEGRMLVAQATANDQPDESLAPTALRSFVLTSGSYQLIDNSGGACLGQCQTPNVRTEACTCLSGYTAVISARILVDVTGGPCGSILYICSK
jgi:hypothetical protein